MTQEAFWQGWLIVLHAVSEKGWIPGVALVFQAKRNTGDYNDEMDHRTSEDWFKTTLL